MKNLMQSIIRTLSALSLMVAISIGFIGTVSAQGKSITKLARHPDVIAPKSLEVAVFQVDNTLKFKVHMENHTDDIVTIKIKNAENKVLYREKVKDIDKYIRKFDFSTMADGDYIFEVTSRNEKYTKEINLQTLSARSLQINE